MKPKKPVKRAKKKVSIEAFAAVDKKGRIKHAADTYEIFADVSTAMIEAGYSMDEIVPVLIIFLD